MKIRCNNCYKVLNNNEEWCTRCGEHSDIIKENLENGVIPIDEAEIGKRNILIYLLVAFLLNGFLSVIFGIIYTSTNQELNLGSVGSSLPLVVTYFSSINSWLITGVILTPLAYLLNSKDIIGFIKPNINKKSIIYIIIGIIGVILLTILMKYTPFNVVAPSIKLYLKSPTSDMLVSGSFNLLKVFVVLICYSIVEEFVFRKAIINMIDEVSIISDFLVIVIDALISVILSVLCFLLLVNTSFFNYIIYIGSSLVFHFLLACNYYLHNRNIFFNIVLRILFIILIIIFI